MTTLRAAAEMALEILQDIHSGNMTPLAEDAWNEAIKALRAAIEIPTPEPVAWMCSDEELLHKGYSRFSKTCVGEWNIPVYTLPPQRKPLTDEPYESPYNPNPVEYQYHYPDGSWRCSNGEVINGMHPDLARSLYALKDNT